MKRKLALIASLAAVLIAFEAPAQVIPTGILTPEEAVFPDTRPQAISTAQTFTLTKTPSYLPLVVFSVRLANSNDFDLTSDNCTGAVLSDGQSCTFDVAFAPLSTGYFKSTVFVINFSREVIDTSTLEGNGVMPAVTLSQTAVAFGDRTIGSPSAPYTVVLRNTGTDTLNVTSIEADGEFAVTDACGAAVDVGAECDLSVVFSPTVVGDASGTVTITDDASDSPQTVALTGTGIAPGSADVSLSKTEVDFGAQTVGTLSDAEPVTLTSDGTVDLTITSIAASGDFTQTNVCGAVMVPTSTCNLEIKFAPTAAGPLTGTVTITDNATDSPQTITLSGTGIEAASPDMSISATSIDFGTVPLDGSSAAHTLTVTNNGPSVLSDLSSAITGDDLANFSEVDHCRGIDVPVGSSCTIDLTLAPHQTGSFSATLTIQSNAVNSPQTVLLTGAGAFPSEGSGCSLIVRK